MNWRPARLVEVGLAEVGLAEVEQAETGGFGGAAPAGLRPPPPGYLRKRRRSPSEYSGVEWA